MRIERDVHSLAHEKAATHQVITTRHYERTDGDLGRDIEALRRRVSELEVEALQRRVAELEAVVEMQGVEIKAKDQADAEWKRNLNALQSRVAGLEKLVKMQGGETKKVGQVGARREKEAYDDDGDAW